MGKNFIRETVIFKNMNDDEFDSVLKFLDVYEKFYSKGEIIFSAGDITNRMGLVIEGSITVQSNDMWGNRNILNFVESGEFFGEVYAMLNDTPMLVDVIANENCRILFMKIENLKNFETVTKSWILKLMHNLLILAINKNLHLSNRMFHTSPKTIRGKITAFLNTISLQKNIKEFDIPFNRQQLADYLNIDRSALSKELSKMKNDNLIDFRKNHFIIKKPEKNYNKNKKCKIIHQNF